MSNGAGGYPEWVSAADRRLLQYFDNGFAASLVVAQDGLGDYRTITEALDALSEQRSRTDRFIIYVKAGVYRENVEIKSNMRNLMFIGDGVDATIITGNKNIIDGTTTFKTATFGEFLS